jgi:magnesium-transporting ATPase (P-type)
MLQEMIARSIDMNSTEFDPMVHYDAMFDATDCTLKTCAVDLYAVFRYRPSLPVNVTVAALFGVIGLIHSYLGIRWKAWGFMVCMQLGCITEAVGYVGRIMLYDNPFSDDAFMMQIITLTCAPVFFTAAVYVTLSKVIIYLDPAASRFKPQLFYWVFIPADILCLILQGAGGAMSSTAEKDDADGIQLGVDISMGGLILQVVVLFLFTIAFSDYMWRYLSRNGASALTWRLKAFFAGLIVAIIAIFARCAFRVAELKDGFDGEMITHEIPFIILESGLMVVGAAALMYGHPGLALKPEDIAAREKIADAERGMSPESF